MKSAIDTLGSKIADRRKMIQSWREKKEEYLEKSRKALIEAESWNNLMEEEFAAIAELQAAIKILS